MGGEELRAVIVKSGIGDDGDRHAQRLEELEAAPRADAVAVVAPTVVQHIGFVARRPELRAQSLTERKVLEVVAEVNGKPAPARPAVVRPRVDRRIGIAAVVLEHYSPR